MTDHLVQNIMDGYIADGGGGGDNNSSQTVMK